MGFIFRLLLAIIAFQLIGGLIRSVRRRSQASRRETSGKGPDRGENSVQSEQYKDLTPYEIEDADFEELPKREE